MNIISNDITNSSEKLSDVSSDMKIINESIDKISKNSSNSNSLSKIKNEF